MKYDLSLIMKNAWTIKNNFEKKTGLKALFSECLKRAWEIAKELKSVISIKEWFLDKNFTSHEKYFILTSSKSIIKETEKAFCIKCKSKLGIKTIWVPKSCLNQYDKFMLKGVINI